MNKNLLCSTGNSTQYSIMTCMDKESKKEWIYIYIWASQVVQWLKNLPSMQEPQESQVGSLGRQDPLGDPLGEGVATHSSILAWRIPWTKEPGRVQSRGSPGCTHVQLIHFAAQQKLTQHCKSTVSQ